VLNAGTPPRMARFDQTSWADFTATWETDVKAGSIGYRRRSSCRSSLEAASLWDRAALPRTDPDVGRLWRRQADAVVHAKYANGVSEQRDLGSASR